MIRAKRHGVETYVEALVCNELERRAPSYVSVEDAGALRDALAELEAAREDLDVMRSDAVARRRLGAMWLSFVEPLVEAVQVAEERVEELSVLLQAPDVSGLTADAYRSLSREERAAVLRAMIGCVFVRSVPGPRGRNAPPIDAHRVRVLWRGQEPADLPAHNKVSPLVPWLGFEDEPPTRMASA
jgi:hypothetical protein